MPSSPAGIPEMGPFRPQAPPCVAGRVCPMSQLVGFGYPAYQAFPPVPQAPVSDANSLALVQLRLFLANVDMPAPGSGLAPRALPLPGVKSYLPHWCRPCPGAGSPKVSGQDGNLLRSCCFSTLASCLCPGFAFYQQHLRGPVAESPRYHCVILSRPPSSGWTGWSGHTWGWEGVVGGSWWPSDTRPEDTPVAPRGFITELRRMSPREGVRLSTWV